MRAIHSCRRLLALLALFGAFAVSIGEETAAGETAGATMSPTEVDDAFTINDLLPGLGDSEEESFVENYIMGQPIYYKETYEPVSKFEATTSSWRSSFIRLSCITKLINCLHVPLDCSK